MTANDNLKERVARIEGTLPHLATKADIKGLEAKIYLIGAGVVLSILTQIGMYLLR